MLLLITVTISQLQHSGKKIYLKLSNGLRATREGDSFLMTVVSFTNRCCSYCEGGDGSSEEIKVISDFFFPPEINFVSFFLAYSAFNL